MFSFSIQLTVLSRFQLLPFRLDGARLVVALGDMLELGQLSDEMHRQAVRDVADASPDQFLAVGPAMGAACQTALDGAPLLSMRAYADSREAASGIRAIVRRGDVVLVKGSRGIEMEKLIEALEKIPIA